MAFDEGTQQAISSPDYFRTGFRPTEIPKLNELIKEGKTAEEIAQYFGVQLEVCKRFMQPASSPAVEPQRAETSKEDKFEAAHKKATRRGRDE